MSLITLLALAFVVTPAMAAEFGVAMSVRPNDDVSSAGDVQQYFGHGTYVDIKFDKVVAIDIGATAGTDATKFHLSDISVIAYNEFNGVEPSPTLSDLHTDGRADGQNYRFWLQGTGNNIKRVLLYLDKHLVEVADPRADLDDAGVRKVDGKNAATSLVINYIEGDQGSPFVYSVRRVSDPLLPISAATVDVIVLLSEEPKPDGFKKDQISVTNATAADPVALVPQLVDQAAVNRLNDAYQDSEDSITRPMFMVMNPSEEEDAPEYILNPEAAAIVGDDSPTSTVDFAEADFDYSTDGYNYSIDEDSLAALKTASDNAKSAADDAEPDIAAASDLDAYELDVQQHAALVAVYSKALMAYTDARDKLVQAQEEEFF
jgi:hypothetical protein